MRSGLTAAAVLCALLAGAGAAAAPYTPRDDAVVLERLPARWGWAQATHAEGAPNLEAALRAARELIETARAEGDPRLLGRAQARLAPWWEAKDAPLEVRVARAAIRQASHEFDSARTDLDQVLERDPGHAQALLLRATLHAVQGRAVASQTDCLKLVRRAPDLVVLACATRASALAGRVAESYTALDQGLRAARGPEPAARLWSLTLAGEMAYRLGRYAAAERHFRDAEALGIRDTYLLAAHADLLLDRGRPGEALALLRGEERNDALLLRQCLALAALRDPRAGAHALALRERFDAARRRGEAPHAREEARFRLAIENDTAGAFALARENWSIQREPADLRLLLEAGFALAKAIP